jgi:hypothetical protein
MTGDVLANMDDHALAAVVENVRLRARLAHGQAQDRQGVEGRATWSR